MSAVLAVTQPFGVGLGQQLPFRIADPAAGANATRSFDGIGLRRILSLVFTLATSSTVAARYVTVEYQGKDGKAFAVGAAGVTVGASSTQRYAGSAFRGDSEWATGTDVLFPLSPVLVFPGDVLTIVVANIDTTDQLSLIRGVEERFPLDANVLPTLEP